MARKDAGAAERLKARSRAPEDRDAGRSKPRSATAVLPCRPLCQTFPTFPSTTFRSAVTNTTTTKSNDPGNALRFRTASSPKEHFTLGEALGQMDFETAAKLSGARFVVLRGGLARLHRALGQYMLDLHVDRHGYEEVRPAGSGARCGHVRHRAITEVPRRSIPRRRRLLADTDGRGAADQSRARARARRARTSAPLHGPDPELPCGGGVGGPRHARHDPAASIHPRWNSSPITTPEASLEEHERMTRAAEAVLEGLGLHYRRMLLCTGDMGFASRKTFDLEVWLPGQNTFREISSCSVCGDFQARRMEARYRPTGAKNTRFVHTLNGSGIAVGRALVAVLENYQKPDGSITVPEVPRALYGRPLPNRSREGQEVTCGSSSPMTMESMRKASPCWSGVAASLSDDVVTVAPESDQSGVAHSLSPQRSSAATRNLAASLRGPRNADRLRHHGGALAACGPSPRFDPVGRQPRAERRRGCDLLRNDCGRHGRHAARHSVVRSQPGLRTVDGPQEPALGLRRAACRFRDPQGARRGCSAGYPYQRQLPRLSAR